MAESDSAQRPEFQLLDITKISDDVPPKKLPLQRGIFLRAA